MALSLTYITEKEAIGYKPSLWDLQSSELQAILYIVETIVDWYIGYVPTEEQPKAYISGSVPDNVKIACAFIAESVRESGEGSAVVRESWQDRSVEFEKRSQSTSLSEFARLIPDVAKALLASEKLSSNLSYYAA